MSDATKIPFEPIPVPALGPLPPMPTAMPMPTPMPPLADPAKPSFSRSTTPPAPAPRKPLIDEDMIPLSKFLPAGIAPEAPEPAKTEASPHQPSWLRRKRMKLVVGAVSIGGAAFGLQELAPNLKPQNSVEQPMEVAKVPAVAPVVPKIAEERGHALPKPSLIFERQEEPQLLAIGGRVDEPAPLRLTSGVAPLPLPTMPTEIQTTPPAIAPLPPLDPAPTPITLPRLDPPTPPAIPNIVPQDTKAVLTPVQLDSPPVVRPLALPPVEPSALPVLPPVTAELPKLPVEAPKPAALVPTPTPVTLPTLDPLPAPAPAVIPAPLPTPTPAPTVISSPLPAPLPAHSPAVSEAAIPLKPLPTAGMTGSGVKALDISQPETPKPVVVGEPKTDYDVDVHRVRNAETYQSLSEKYYGSAQYAGALKAYNRGAELPQLKEVQVPPMYVVRKMAPATAPAAPAAAPEIVPVGSDPAWTGVGAAKNDGEVRFVPYRVPRQGMTMRDVAKAVYGRESEWPRVDNRRNIKYRPDEELPVGAELQVPVERPDWR